MKNEMDIHEILRIQNQLYELSEYKFLRKLSKEAGSKAKRLDGRACAWLYSPLGPSQVADMDQNESDLYCQLRGVTNNFYRDA